VLTRDSQLHLFALDEDLATHPDVIAAIFRPATADAPGYGGSAGHLQALSAAVVEAANSARAAAAQKGGADGDSVDIADAAAAAGKATPRPVGGGGGGGGGGFFRLPPPALPGELIGYAASYANRVDDLLPAGPDPVPRDFDPLALPRKAGTPPGTSFELTASTKLGFANSYHAHAFELADAKGWFGSSKLLLRALNQEDMVDWICALNAMVDATSA
jgi:hypothetical protein